MSVVIVVESEDQLDCGLLWYGALARQNNLIANIIVVGADRKTLGEHAKRRFLEQVSGDRVKVHFIDRDVEALLSQAKSLKCRYLLIVHRASGGEFQRLVFEASTSRTIWVRGNPRAWCDPR